MPVDFEEADLVEVRVLSSRLSARVPDDSKPTRSRRARSPLMPSHPGPFTTRFQSGPVLHVPSIGWLPGPPHSLHPLVGDAVFFVDDAHAGEVYAQGTKIVTLISTACALSWMSDDAAARLRPSISPPPAPPSVQWLSKAQAAAALGVSPRALEDVRVQAPADLPDSPHPAGAGKKRVQWRYPARPSTLQAWWKAATRAVRLTPLPVARRPRKPRRSQQPKSAPTTRRSVLAMVEDERG